MTARKGLIIGDGAPTPKHEIQMLALPRGEARSGVLPTKLGPIPPSRLLLRTLPPHPEQGGPCSEERNRPRVPSAQESKKVGGQDPRGEVFPEDLKTIDPRDEPGGVHVSLGRPEGCVRYLPIGVGTAVRKTGSLRSGSLPCVGRQPRDPLPKMQSWVGALRGRPRTNENSSGVRKWL